MTEKSLFLAFLSQFDLQNKKIHDILARMDEPSIDNFFKLDLDKIFSHEKLEEINSHAGERELNSYLNNLNSLGIGFVTRDDENFPQKLLPLDDCPHYLFYKGDLSLADSQSVAIVGTRSPSSYGRIVTERFAGALAQSGLTIISGLAYGVDSIAHRKTLDEGGKTIAVLGSGLNNIYPAEHTNLAKEIAQKGLLLSEYSVSTKPSRYTFPLRNRIIAALSDGALITEAGEKSGTVHTKEYALDYGKNLYAIPGSITNEKSALPNALIKTGQADCVTSADDILADFNLSQAKPEARPVQLGIVEQKIYDYLKTGEKDIDELCQNANLSVNLLSSYLTTMEINGLIRKMPGGFYTLA